MVLNSRAQSVDKVSMHSQTKQVANGKLIKIDADVYYRTTTGNLTVHYTYPMEYIFITNRVGEAKIYFPTRNEVQIQRNPELSSENDLLYYFLEGKSYDMGLNSLGFTISNTKFDAQGRTITYWQAPVDAAHETLQIEMVHNNNLPIYAAYYDKKQKITRKIYYYNYVTQATFAMPTSVTTISYTAKGDSLVARKTYSDIKTGTQATGTYFDFKIPNNAKIIEK